MTIDIQVVGQKSNYLIDNSLKTLSRQYPFPPRDRISRFFPTTLAQELSRPLPY